MAHTPGPWATGDGAEIYPVDGPCSQVELARVAGPWSDSSWYDKRTAESNARLIAVSPDLLQCVIDMIDSIDGESEFTMWDDGWQELYVRAKAAVAKATGVSTEGTHGEERSLDG